MTVPSIAHEELALRLDERPGGNPGFEGHAHIGWESRYVSEGRDNLDGDGLLVAMLEFGWQSLTLGTWYADSPQNGYNEWQMNAAFTRQWGDFEAYIGYTHLRFPEDDTSDHEFGLGFSWAAPPWELTIGADAYHSIDASGSFIETYLIRDFDFADRLVFSPSLVIGFNDGYVADGHDGANHIALQFGLEYEIASRWWLETHVAYSWAIDRNATRHPGDAPLRDFLHCGAGIRCEF